MRGIELLGVPSAAGTHGPGQEDAPAWVRDAGLLTGLAARGVAVRDQAPGGAPGQRLPGGLRVAVGRVAGVQHDRQGHLRRVLPDRVQARVVGGEVPTEQCSFSTRSPMSSTALRTIVSGWSSPGWTVQPPVTRTGPPRRAATRPAMDLLRSAAEPGRRA